MGSLAYIALVLALAVGIYLLIRYQRERQKELYRMEALRDSRLYKDIYPLILRAAARDLDQVRIERDRITRANGSVDYGYVYTIRTPYKDAVMEARRRISMRIGI